MTITKKAAMMLLGPFYVGFEVMLYKNTFKKGRLVKTGDRDCNQDLVGTTDFRTREQKLRTLRRKAKATKQAKVGTTTCHHGTPTDQKCSLCDHKREDA